MLGFSLEPNSDRRSEGDTAEGGALHILCLGAHADDCEIGAAGALLTLLTGRPGSTVTWVVATGDPVRSREARDSAEALLRDKASVDIRQLGLRESYLDRLGPEVKEAFEEVRSSLSREPDVVLTHHRQDRHQDHRAVSDITWNLWRDHLVLEYEVPKWDGDLGQPNFYVPLTPEVAERKLSHLAGHFASQRGKDWYDDGTFRGLMRLRGMECRAPSGYAEAFYARKVILG